MGALKRLFFIIKCKKLELFHNINFGKNVKVLPQASVKEQNGEIQIGNNCVIERNTYISAVSGGKVHLANNVYFNRNSIIVARDMIEIGENTIFGPGVYIYDHNHKFSKNGVENEFNKEKIVIGSNCWIGAGCIILKGAHIGNNSVIGAGVVVSGEIPEYSLVRMGQDSYSVSKII